MKLRALLHACCVLLSAGSLFAQSAGTAADPISGTWTGDMGPGPTERNAMTVELKFDGKAAVSGTITGPNLTPGEIKAGTFDPRTGALKLEVTVQGRDGVVVLEGTMVRGTAIGRVTLGSQTGSFKITKAGDEAAAGQQAGGADAAATLRKSFGEVSGWVTKAADLVPADKYTYRPAQSVRTFGQLIAHVADAHNYYCARAAGRNVQWSDAIEKGSTDKATLSEKLKQSIDACNAAYGAGQVGPLVENVGHTNLHYGNIITYMRMLGLVPPSS
jgi:hypothetical protein